MEYEDSFPYHGPLANLTSTIPYDNAKLQYFLTRAHTLDIEIIPLIQTFGHMEHALKLKEFQHLRESKEHPDSICPSNNESINLIKEMLHQVIDFHTTITPLKHIHIGCDEVYQLNKCQKCHDRNLANRNLFLDHMNTVKTLVYNFNPLISILMWDDMFRKINRNQWNEETMANLQEMEPVYWDYSPNLGRVSHMNLFRYHGTFRNIWIASAFKGADGKQAFLPELNKRFQNHYAWLNLILNYMFAGEKKVFNFKGVILTGWSRYSHLDPLCELLPSSLSSLVMNLLLIQKYRDGVTISDTLLEPHVFLERYIVKKLTGELNCNDNFIMHKNIGTAIATYNNKSNTLVASLKRYKILVTDIDATFKNDVAIVSLVEYYSHIRNLNVQHSESALNWCKKILKEILRWEKETSLILMKYYDKFVIEEYIGYKTYSVKTKIKKTFHNLKQYLKVNVWKRRSYNFSFR
ncbi:unnamed protein product [Arctia plantaginis]|uniref:beta-N-acetylhexosaminidase n=1 Tax=Arctia plantaginis TaxID=874455 RepID=A0A8S0Z438_ARCPL|nr:unnamed protein product [Arctia plantaginis]